MSSLIAIRITTWVPAKLIKGGRWLFPKGRQPLEMAVRAEVQTLQPITETQLDEQQRQTLESILTPHLRLEPKEDELSQRPRPREGRQINEGIKNQQQRVRIEVIMTSKNIIHLFVGSSKYS